MGDIAAAAATAAAAIAVMASGIIASAAYRNNRKMAWRNGIGKTRQAWRNSKIISAASWQ